MSADKALQLLRYLPRVNLENLVRNPYAKAKQVKKRGQWNRKGRGLYGQKGYLQHAHYLPLGFQEGLCTPFHLTMPVENYYKDIKHRRQYPPYTLHQLQLSIDQKRINPEQPIDLATLCATHTYHIDPLDNQYGVHLTDDGIDCFKAKVNIEVQHATEQVIAAVERNGGTITVAYYDIYSVQALNDPKKFFERGVPIPKRLLPPPDCIGAYSDPAKRGYLADPEQIAVERVKLAQKYGYTLPDLTNDSLGNILTLRKDPRQVYWGLEPGWVVNLKDKRILKPCHEVMKNFYSS